MTALEKFTYDGSHDLCHTVYYILHIYILEKWFFFLSGEINSNWYSNYLRLRASPTLSAAFFSAANNCWMPCVLLAIIAFFTVFAAATSLRYKRYDMISWTSARVMKCWCADVLVSHTHGIRLIRYEMALKRTVYHLFHTRVYVYVWMFLIIWFDKHHIFYIHILISRIISMGVCAIGSHQAWMPWSWLHRWFICSVIYSFAVQASK